MSEQPPVTLDNMSPVVISARAGSSEIQSRILTNHTNEAIFFEVEHQNASLTVQPQTGLLEANRRRVLMFNFRPSAGTKENLPIKIITDEADILLHFRGTVPKTKSSSSARPPKAPQASKPPSDPKARGGKAAERQLVPVSTAVRTGSGRRARRSSIRSTDLTPSSSTDSLPSASSKQVKRRVSSADRNAAAKGRRVLLSTEGEMMGPGGRGRARQRQNKSGGGKHGGHAKTEEFLKAVKKGDVKSTKALEPFVDINARGGGKGGKTALLLAARHGHFKLVKYLVLKGADIDLAELFDNGGGMFKFGRPGLAVEMPSLQIKFDFDDDDEQEKDQGHLRLKGRGTDEVDGVVLGGLGDNEPSTPTPGRGYTPLLVAAEANRHEVVRYLVRQGCNLAYRDEWGNCVYDVVSDQRHMMNIKRSITLGLRDKWLHYLKKLALYDLSLLPHLNEVVVSFVWGDVDDQGDLVHITTEDYESTLALTYTTSAPPALPPPTTTTTTKSLPAPPIVRRGVGGPGRVAPYTGGAVRIQDRGTGQADDDDDDYDDDEDEDYRAAIEVDINVTDPEGELAKAHLLPTDDRNQATAALAKLLGGIDM